MYLTIRSVKNFDEVLLCALSACAVTRLDVHFRYRGGSYVVKSDVGAGMGDYCVVWRDGVRDARYAVNVSNDGSTMFDPVSRF